MKSTRNGGNAGATGRCTEPETRLPAEREQIDAASGWALGSTTRCTSVVVPKREVLTRGRVEQMDLGGVDREADEPTRLELVFRTDGRDQMGLEEVELDVILYFLEFTFGFLVQVEIEIGVLAAAPPFHFVDLGRETDRALERFRVTRGCVRTVLRPDANDDEILVSNTIAHLIVKRQRRERQFKRSTADMCGDEVHRRRTDEACHEHVHRVVIEISRRRALVHEALMQDRNLAVSYT